MNLLDAFQGAASGGLIGALGSIGTGIVGIFAKKQAMKERAQEAKIQLESQKLMMDANRDEAEHKSFIASQDAAKSESKEIIELAKMPSSPKAKLALVSIAWLRGTCRTLLTWYTHILLIPIFMYWASPEIQDTMIMSIITMASTYGLWWFGSKTIHKYSEK